MPLRRSPPPAPCPKVISIQGPPPLSQSCDSDTPSERSGAGVTLRPKRRREQDDDMKDLKSEMRGLFNNLTASVEQRFNEIKQQNNDLQFMSDRYDSVLEKLQILEEDRMKERRHIQFLEDKIVTLERKIKSTGIEIRNIPRLTNNLNKPETKLEMCELVKAIAESVGTSLQVSDIKDIYRINSNKEVAKPLIAELNSVMIKEDMLRAVKNFNKERSKGEKLNTQHLKITGPPRPVFLSETLTFNTQKIFYLTREFARENQYSYCWTSRGIIYLRKAEGQPLIRINSETDLHKLKSSN